MNWRRRPDGSIDLAVLTGFDLATTDDAVALRLTIARTQEQLKGEAESAVEQLVMSPAIATALLEALTEMLKPGSRIN